MQKKTKKQKKKAQIPQQNEKQKKNLVMITSEK